MAAELRGLQEVEGGGRSDQAGPRRYPQPSPGCGDVSLLSKCNMLNKAPLLLLAPGNRGGYSVALGRGLGANALSVLPAGVAQGAAGPGSSVHAPRK